MEDMTKVKVDIEVTGHYGYNLLGYLLAKAFMPHLINPLHTNLYKSKRPIVGTVIKSSTRLSGTV